MERQINFKDTIIKGIIHEIDGKYCTVELPQYQSIFEYDVLLCNSGSSSNRADFAPSVGDNVLVAFDHDGDAYILQSWFDNTNSRPFSDEQKGIKYSNDKQNYYDINLDTYYLDPTNIELSSADNWAVKYNELLTILNDIKTYFNLHTHTSAAAGNPTTAPLAPNTYTYTSTTVKSDKIKIG